MGTEEHRIHRSDEQEVVIFHGHRIIAVRLDSGQIVVFGTQITSHYPIERQRRNQAIDILFAAMNEPPHMQQNHVSATKNLATRRPK